MMYLMFITALALSGIAAWYAIAGLMAIFAAAAIPIAIMGSALEVSKLVVASWLYRNWKEVPKLLKLYFIIALIILMTLTSMGIFGFLSKAHLDQALPSGDIQAKVENIEEKIEFQREIITQNRELSDELSSQINRYTELGSVSKGVRVRKSQAEEREQIQNAIQTAQNKIEELNKEKFEITKELRSIEAEVGPIKYIAALIYGDNADSTILEKAVRIVILMIVAVFDPLAVLMLVAANWSFKNRKLKIPPPPVKKPKQKENPPPFETGVPLTQEDRWNSYTESKPEVDKEEKFKEWDAIFNNILPQQKPSIKEEIKELLDEKTSDNPTIVEEVDAIQNPTTPSVSIKEIDYDQVNKKAFKK